MTTEKPEVADRRELQLSASDPLRLRTRVAGIFLFLPLLVQLKFDKLVRSADYPGTEMVPADAALLSLLALKLLDKERRSHIDDFNCDEALGLFAGLNVMPQKSFTADYSYRTQRTHQQQLLQGWIENLSPILMPQAESFSLDFHPIVHRGDDNELENHYLPLRGKAGPSVQTFFAQEQKRRVLCYANANLTRAEQSGEWMRFVEFWRNLTGENPKWLYFDSKLVPYSELSRVNQQGISFVTIRRRGTSLLRGINQLPAEQWTSAVIDIPKRRHQRIEYVDQTITLRDYEGDIRQIAARGMGRAQPSLFLSNNFDVTPRELIMNYARRNGIEDSLGTSVNFFHLDCLSSEVRLNVDLDVTMTVLANGCYRWLGSQLSGFEQTKPKSLYRKFIETSGTVEVASDRRLVVTFDRRSHNPILREAKLDVNSPPIPWLQNHRVEFHYS
ncbi:MAG: hypothetical protein IH991_04305 [Planctomycetes bacterium]|nr:hypothetical protein [Planctomycetota bacterium]